MAYAVISDSLYQDWSDATQDGIVTGSVEDGLETMLDGVAPEDEDDQRALPRPVTGSGRITKKAADSMRRWSRRRMSGVIGPKVTELVGSFDRDAALLTQKAAELGWSKPRYTKELNQLAAAYGREGIAGHIIKTWWRTVVVNESFNRGLMAMLSEDPTSRLYPFVENTWIESEDHREDHSVLYVVAVTSPLAQLHVPPLGFNCQCGRRAINWREARERGLDPEQELPLGPATTVSGIAPANSLGA